MSSAERVIKPRAAEVESSRKVAPKPAKRVEKSADAFRTISEVADELEVPQHVLRFWETKFTQIRPMKRGGGRRYYRPEDVDLLRSIRGLLYDQGYTIKGVQKLIREGGLRLAGETLAPAPDQPIDEHDELPEGGAQVPGTGGSMMDLPLFRAALDDGQIRDVKSAIDELKELRDRLRRAAGA
ncbi:MAG TPA: MerR family transcriptional regulator [Terriglobia bacterium]|nr:MerR family transcriptional regulator [Terriglobia bacterium]